MAKATVEPIAAGNEEILNLRLDQITLDPVTDVRTGPKQRDEEEKINDLAKSIFDQGQLQPVVVRRNGNDGHFLLTAGRRRYAAIARLQEILDAGKPEPIAGALKARGPLTVKAVLVSKSDDEAFAAAIQENLQRRDFSAIEFANNIAEIRKRFGWDGSDWTNHVSDFLRVSRATVKQTYKLLDLPKDIQQRVHTGKLSAQSAIDLHSVTESQREQVLARAEELSDKEEAAEAKKPKTKATKGKSKDAEEETGKIKRKHILAAAREAEALTTVKPRTRNELLAPFQAILDSADPYPEPINEFCRVFLTRFATGHQGERALFNKLDAIAELIGDKAPKKASKKSA